MNYNPILDHPQLSCLLCISPTTVRQRAGASRGAQNFAPRRGRHVEPDHPGALVSEAHLVCDSEGGGGGREHAASTFGDCFLVIRICSIFAIMLMKAKKNERLRPEEFCPCSMPTENAALTRN